MVLHLIPFYTYSGTEYSDSTYNSYNVCYVLLSFIKNMVARHRYIEAFDSILR